MSEWTLYWRTGKREVVKGDTVAQAMTLAGYSGGAVRALDFYAEGVCHEWRWHLGDRDWFRDGRPTVPAPADGA